MSTVRVLAFSALWWAVAMFAATEAAPGLSTAERVALNALESQKQQIEQQELEIVREWNAAHAGWHLDQGFRPVKDEVKNAPSK